MKLFRYIGKMPRDVEADVKGKDGETRKRAVAFLPNSLYDLENEPSEMIEAIKAELGDELLDAMPKPIKGAKTTKKEPRDPDPKPQPPKKVESKGKDKSGG